MSKSSSRRQRRSPVQPIVIIIVVIALAMVAMVALGRGGSVSIQLPTTTVHATGDNPTQTPTR